MMGTNRKILNSVCNLSLTETKGKTMSDKIYLVIRKPGENKVLAHCGTPVCQGDEIAKLLPKCMECEGQLAMQEGNGDAFTIATCQSCHECYRIGLWTESERKRYLDSDMSRIGGEWN